MKISIVIPTHNRPNLLKKAIKSVINQTYKNIEIIIIDDASIIDNKSIINNFKKTNIIYYKFNKNQGGNICRNKGVELSSGDYISFLDDDDIWNSKKLEIQLDFMLKNDLDLSYTARSILKVKDNKEISQRYSFKKITIKNNIKKSIMQNNFIGPTSSIMIKKELFFKVKGFDIEMPAMQDYDLYIRCIFNNARVLGINKALVDYYIFLNNKSIGRSLKKSNKARKLFIKKYRNYQYFNILYFNLLNDFLKRRVKYFINYIEGKK
jgi:glycosyltransferase involved in cell wall biosynthesis